MKLSSALSQVRLPPQLGTCELPEQEASIASGSVIVLSLSMLPPKCWCGLYLVWGLSSIIRDDLPLVYSAPLYGHSLLSAQSASEDSADSPGSRHLFSNRHCSRPALGASTDSAAAPSSQLHCIAPSDFYPRQRVIASDITRLSHLYKGTAHEPRRLHSLFPCHLLSFIR